MPTTATPRRPDRRVARTVALLRDALMTLIQEKGYDAITVQDITDRANVARTTFYLHFKDKDELLFEGMRAIYDDLVERAFRKVGSADETPDSHDPLAGFDIASPADFEHVAEHAAFYRVMLSERGSMAFTLRVMDYLARLCDQDFLSVAVARGAQPRIPVEIIAHIMAGAQIGVIRWWLENDQPHTPEAMGLMGRDLMVNGLAWALGLAEAPSRAED